MSFGPDTCTECQRWFMQHEALFSVQEGRFATIFDRSHKAASHRFVLLLSDATLAWMCAVISTDIPVCVCLCFYRHRNQENAVKERKDEGEEGAVAQQ